MDIQIIVATHKKYPIPSDPMYLPVQAGAATHPRLPYTADNTGDNISAKNASYCELTALYWAWKNLDFDYLGLCHYRRYFAWQLVGRKRSRVLTEEMARLMLCKTPVVLPRKRNYYIETGYSQYVHAHHEQDLIQTRTILKEKYPLYTPFFDKTLNRSSGHRFNMFIMRRDLLNSYCTWLFDVLFSLEEQLDTSSYNENDRRVYGFIAERLLDVWIETNQVPYCELPVLHTESQHWLNKGIGFLKRKYLPK